MKIGRAIKGYGVGSILTGGAGGAIGAAIGGTEADKKVGLKDLMLGKKDPGTPSQFIDLEDTLRKNVDEARGRQFQNLGFLSNLGQRAFQEEDKSGLLARMQATQQERGLMGQAADQRRAIEANIARRGMGNSAAGLAAMAGADRSAAEGIIQTRANLPLLQEQLRREQEQNRLQQVLAASQGINQIQQAPGEQRAFIQGMPSQGRKGGLLNLGLMAGGAYLGSAAGPAGALAGMQIGQGLGGAVQNY